jgi:hypothetical protein
MSAAEGMGCGAVKGEQQGFSHRGELHQLHSCPVRIKEIELPLAVSPNLRAYMLVVQATFGIEGGHSLFHVLYAD